MNAPSGSGDHSAASGAGQHRDLLRAVIDNLPDSIFAKDSEGRFVMANEAAARVMGHASSEEIIGHNDEELVEAARADQYREIDGRVLKGGEPLLNHEEFHLDGDGRPRWDLTTKVPLRDAEGRVWGLVAISRDITLQKLADERLREALIELREAQARLVESENARTVGRLAVGIAHEIQNPLQVALMGLDCLMQESFPAESLAPAVIAEMRTSLRRADAIVREVLAFSKPKPVELARHEIEPVIDESLGRMRADLAGIVVERERGPHIPALPMDRDQISGVFDSLFRNAIAAMNGAGQLLVSTRASQLTGIGPNVAGRRGESFRVGDMVVTVLIEDTGPGVPADQLDKVFEPFFTTAPTGQGAGLGLTVARAIMDLHGGAISLHNRTAGGLCVELMFKA